jgi:hypothetical protein
VLMMQCGRSKVNPYIATVCVRNDNSPSCWLTSTVAKSSKQDNCRMDIIAGSADVFHKDMLLSNTLVHEIPDCDTPSDPIV